MNFELFSASPAILNCLVYNYGLQGKHRRLWRLAVAPQPPIAGHQSRSAEPAAHTQSAGRSWVRGYHSITLNQLLLHLLASVGAWLRRDAIASYVYTLLIYNFIQ